MASNSRLFPLAILSLSFSSCVFLGTLNPFLSDNDPPPVEDQNAELPTEETTKVSNPKEISTKASSVDVLWQVPTDAVEKYHVYYGFEVDELANHVEIPIADLEKKDHPKYGPVYRYELKNIPASQAIYVSIAAENKYGKSDPTPAVRVEPGTRTVTP